MRSMSLEYPTQPYSKVNRYDARATYALETIHSIVNTSPFVHVSFNVPGNPYPMTLPMIGQMASFDRPSADTGDVLDLYVHGYVSSRLMNRSREEEEEGASSAEREEEGLPVTIAASHLDGLVLSLTPNTHDYNYRSAVLFGRASVVTDPDEKLWAMELITDSVARDRWRHTRVPPNKGEMASTSILRVKIKTGSAKVRTGQPRDDKADAENEDLLGSVWTGVIPVYQTMGEPIMRGDCKVASGEVPGYLREFVEEGNKEARENAVEIATTAMAVKKKADDDD